MSRIDTDALKRQLNLPEFVMARVGQLKRVGSTEGGIWRGPCPRCGGHDRFTVKGRGRWNCTHCHEKWADVFDFLKWLDGVSFTQAVAIVTDYIGLSAAPTVDGIAPSQVAPAGPRHIEEPTAEWRERAEALVVKARAHFQQYPELFRILKRTRGLEPETVRAWDIGHWMGEWIFPARYQGRLYYVKKRAAVEGAAGRWSCLAGGKEAGVPYGADLCRGYDTLIVVEGHGDAVLMWQAVHELADVITLGSVVSVPSAEANELLRSHKRVLAAHDSDEPGEAAAAKLIAECGGERLCPPVHKDWLDAWRAGYDIAAHVVRHLGPSECDARRDWLELKLDFLRGNPKAETLKAVLAQEYLDMAA